MYVCMYVMYVMYVCIMPYVLLCVFLCTFIHTKYSLTCTFCILIFNILIPSHMLFIIFVYIHICSSATFVDFSADQIDIKRAYRKELSSSVGIRLKFVPDVNSPRYTNSGKGYEMVNIDDVSVL